MRWLKYILLSFPGVIFAIIVAYKYQTGTFFTPSKEKIYFARRMFQIGHESRLFVDPNMSINDLKKSYYNKEITYKDYIHNGPWVMRSVLEENKYVNENPLPKDMNRTDIWKITQGQINNCNVLVAVVSPKSYGTLAEVAYAVGRGNIAVYVFPDQTMSEEDISDLWYIFQMALSTKHLWKEKHFTYKPNIFPEEKLTPEKYAEKIKSITPKVLRS